MATKGLDPATTLTPSNLASRLPAYPVVLCGPNLFKEINMSAAAVVASIDARQPRRCKPAFKSFPDLYTEF